MRDIKDLCARIEDELSKIADSGLTTGNLEMTYKLIDMYKDIKNTYYWDKKVEYYNTVLDELSWQSKKETAKRQLVSFLQYIL